MRITRPVFYCRMAVLLLLSSCAAIPGERNKPAGSPDEKLIRDTYVVWVQTTNARDIEAWSEYLAPDAYFVPPGVAPLATRKAITDYYEKSFADPEFSLDCQQLEVHVDVSATMAWARGTCRVTFSDPVGSRAQARSRWFKIWLKQPDGTWKCRVNTWNIEDN